MHDCCNQGRVIIEGSQVPLPLFCSFYFRTPKQGHILYRILEGIFIICRPLSHFCSPSPTFCSHSHTFWLILSHFWLTLSHFMLIWASWSRYPVWSLNPRPGSHAWLSDRWKLFTSFFFILEFIITQGTCGLLKEIFSFFNCISHGLFSFIIAIFL